MADQNQGFKVGDVLNGAGDVLTGAGDLTDSLKRISTQGFPVLIRIEPQTLILFCIGIIITATLAGALTALVEGLIKKSLQ